MSQRHLSCVLLVFQPRNINCEQTVDFITSFMLVLNDIWKKNGYLPISYIDLVVNPDSLARTMKNIETMALLIGDHLVEMRNGKNGLLLFLLWEIKMIRHRCLLFKSIKAEFTSVFQLI